MSKKYFFIFLILVVVVLLSVWLFNYFNEKNNTNTAKVENTSQNYLAEKTKTNTNTNSNADNDNTSTIEITKNATSVSEKEIANFSTKIYTKDSNRQNNISITCNTLNGTEVKSGETFSFCNTVGKATTAKGYKEADIYTSDGKVTKGLGGGNCQVSTTLYNAVLKISGLNVTERHAHSNNVPYIEKGKDAAVAYGGYDLKFVNNLDYSIKIQAENSKDYVKITLVSLNS